MTRLDSLLAAARPRVLGKVTAVVGLSVPRYILPAPSEIYVQFIRNFVRIAGYTLVTGGESFVGSIFRELPG